MSSSFLLIDEPPLQVLPTLATHIGLNEAIIIQQVHYWIGVKKRCPEKYAESFKEGELWVYNSTPEWQQQFPFWGDNTIRRALTSLIEKEILIAKRLSSDAWDKTYWYRINYDNLKKYEELAPPKKGSIKKRSDRSNQDGAIDDTKLGISMHPDRGYRVDQDGQMDTTKVGASLAETPPKTTQEKTSENAESLASLSSRSGRSAIREAIEFLEKNGLKREG